MFSMQAPIEGARMTSTQGKGWLERLCMLYCMHGLHQPGHALCIEQPANAGR